MLPKISIIVPVYRAEQYIHQCLDSLLAQTMSDFEILLIDDGSPDRSGKICDEYAQKDARIRVFHKKNGGVSSARNFGLERARGEWIGFVDSDDEVSEDYLRLAYSKVNDSNADLVVMGYKRIDESGNKISRLKYDGNTHSVADYVRDCSLSGSSCMHLFNKRIIDENNIKFNEQLAFSEDRLFILEYLLCSETIVTVDADSYFYRVNPNSATHSNYTRKKLQARINAIEAMIELIDKYSTRKDSKVLIGAFMPYMLNDYMYDVCLYGTLSDIKTGEQHFRRYHSILSTNHIDGFNDWKLKCCPRSLLAVSLYLKFRSAI